MRAFSLKAYGRILWREAAEQYAFCIGVFALLITLQASWVTMEVFNMAPPPTVAFGFSMTLFMTAIYAAGSSALLFTAEVDAGTFSFQRTKPIGWFTYLWGKLSWTVASSILLGLVAWIETGVWLGVFPSARDASFALGVCGVGIVEGMAWGLIASMLFRGPLRAVIAGIAMASLGAWLTVAIHHGFADSGTVAVTTAYYEGAWLRLIVAALVLAAGFPLARVWYRTGQPLRLLRLRRYARAETWTDATAGEWNSLDPPCRGRSIRLLWQGWRQIRTPVIVYWCSCVAVLVLVARGYYVSRVKDFHSSHEQELAACIGMTAFAFVVFSSLLAGYTFGADQKARFLQLARDGISPWEIWRSRLAAMGVVMLPPAIVVLGGLRLAIPHDYVAMFWPLAAFLVMVGYVSILTVGQACSMFVCSRIIALLAAPVMMACFAFWIVVGVYVAGLGWKLGAMPLLLALLIGSRLLVGTRLRQDSSWRAMRVPALLVVVAVVCTYQALAYHRVNEIRPYDSVVRLDASLMVLTPELALKGARHQADWDDVHASPREWIERVLLDQGDEATAKLADRIRDPWRQNSLSVFGRATSYQVRTYREMLMADAELNRVLREVTSESEVPNDRLRVCIDFLEEWGQQRSMRSRWLAADYQRDMIWLRFGPMTHEYGNYGFHVEQLPWHYRWLSFERTRALQLLDRTYRIAVDRADTYEKAVIDDQFSARLRGYGLANRNGYERSVRSGGLVSGQDIIPLDPSRPIWYQASNQGLLEVSTHRDEFRLLHSLWQLQWEAADPLYTAESQRRGTILYLALQMYHNDHDELPESLEVLVNERYLRRLPLTPLDCKPFYYEPIGGREELNEVIRPLTQHEVDVVRAHGMDTLSLSGHNATRPFLAYPVRESQHMGLGTGLGVFIDLDLVEQGGAEQTLVSPDDIVPGGGMGLEP